MEYRYSKTNRHLIYSLFLIFIIVAVSCSGDNNLLKKEFVKNRNNKEFEKVIDFYKKQGDSLKLKAAYFLIENMSQYWTKDSDCLAKYESIFPYLDTLYHFENNNIDSIDKNWKYHFNDLNAFRGYEPLKDADNITADFIIENIEYAFLAWEQTGKKYNISFDQFCEYILPHRVYDEPLIFWRRHLTTRLYLLTSFRNRKNRNEIHSLTDELNNYLTWFKLDYSYFDSYPGGISLDNLYKTRFGTCIHLDELITFSNRALGIPTAIDYTPFFADRNKKHNWTAVVDKDNETYAFSTSFMNPIKGQKLFDGRIAKVFRKTFSQQPTSLSSLLSNQDNIPDAFLAPNMIDVTDRYPPVSDVILQLVPLTQNSGYAYLCVFDNQNWNAIHWSRVNPDHSICFGKMRRNIVYLPSYFENKTYIPAGDPFILTNSGNVKILKPDTLHKRKITVTRKYPLFANITSFATYLIGGKFQVANNPDFVDAVNLYTIKSCPKQTSNIIKVNDREGYRYVRYLSAPYCWGNIAELEFMSYKNSVLIPLTGAKIGSENNNISINKAFDNNYDTFYESKELGSCWIGLDLGSKKRISEIRFIPRTDNNAVVPGEVYELVYWDKEWKSCGIKKAESNALTFENVPSGALYLLHNLTKGKEERIFTYENNNQIWW